MFGPTPGNGQFYPVAIQGNMFRGGNQTAPTATLTAGLTTTYTGGLILANPITSPVNLIVMRAKCAFDAVQTNAALIGLSVGYNKTTAILTPGTALESQNVNQAYQGGAAPKTANGLLYSPTSATLPTAPVLFLPLGHVGSEAETGVAELPAFSEDIQGGLILPPGGYCQFYSSATGTASSFFGNFMWVELPAGATAG